MATNKDMTNEHEGHEEDWSALRENLIAEVVEMLNAIALTVDEVREYFRDPEVIAAFRDEEETDTKD